MCVCVCVHGVVCVFVVLCVLSVHLLCTVSVYVYVLCAVMYLQCASVCVCCV